MMKRPALCAASIFVLAVISSGYTAPLERGQLENHPIVFGAWLYRDNCKRCHGSYDEEELAASYSSLRELKKAVEKDGCSTDWASRFGGKFSNSELTAVVTYMWQYEQEGAPTLPELPPPEVEDQAVFAPEIKGKEGYVLKEPEKQTLPLALEMVVNTRPVAKGGWLYTTTCYRCHLGYEKARMGRGIQREVVQRTIINGKTSTQMKPFAVINGGQLNNSEIQAIVAYISAWEEFDSPPAIAERLMTPPAADSSSLQPLGIPHFPEVHGNAQRGERVFARKCSACHGLRGQGYIGPSLVKEWKVIRDDLYIKSVIKQGVPNTLMPGWKQGNTFLTPEQTDDVVVLLREQRRAVWKK
ncbi:c-type cytochrome [Desulfogranum japonicum]|uniref:c-type cytochrome n=1 Tax=Desulfogranum japonicum TaxID=231447 RepID=UPI0004121A13|nr:c-type cytochrome [Desulfogranum japonicum]